MNKVVISGTGVFTPEKVITNAELVEAFNAYADRQNEIHADEIAAGEREPMEHSSEAFIVKASGIEQRYVLDKSGVLDPEIMHPMFAERRDDELSLMAEMAVKRRRPRWRRLAASPKIIDAVSVAASNHERAYPAIAIEVQDALGIDGFGFDMNVACSSATFGIQAAADMIRSGSANCDPDGQSGDLLRPSGVARPRLPFYLR